MTIHDKAFKRVIDVFDPDTKVHIVKDKIREIYSNIGFSGSTLKYKVDSMYNKALYNHRKIEKLAGRRAGDAEELRRLSREYRPSEVRVTKLFYRRAKDAVELKRTRDLFRNR
jgi:hypothetical protein